MKLFERLLRGWRRKKLERQRAEFNKIYANTLDSPRDLNFKP